LEGVWVAEFSYDAVLLISGVILVAASLQGITGFGFNMLAVPALILVYSPQVVVPGVIMSFIPLGLLQTLLMWRLIDFRIWGSFVISALFALPFGAYILGQADAEMMRMGIGAMMIGLAALLQLRPGNPFSHDFLSRIGTGFLSGALAASTGVSGPPLVLLGLKQKWPYLNFRATLIAYFTMVSLLSIPFHWHMGLVHGDTVRFAGAAFPGLVGGFFLGKWLRSLVNAQIFRWVALGMVMLGGVSAIIF
jgi:uncharacterized membrane protein YfcA